MELPATLAFDYPTPADAAAMLTVRMANAVAHAADASIVEELEPTAHGLALQQAFPETGVSGNINKSLPSVPFLWIPTGLVLQETNSTVCTT